ncbi:MAG TPA: hypothetical protein VFP50_06065 [Anaeromyxobacteraceae bacterium]|nr:hypothetical protein [Anaeromyxobacteraceae bacterium]
MPSPPVGEEREESLVIEFAPPPEPEPPPIFTLPPPETWLDTSRSAIARTLFWPVLAFDRFFADEREVDEQRALSFIRWRSELKLDSDGKLTPGTSIKAELRFPGFSRRLERLRLTIAGDTSDALQALLPGETPPGGTSGQASAGLRYELIDALYTKTDLSAGLLLQLPVGAFSRLRFRHTLPLGEVALSRYAVAGFWQTNTGWGTRLDADLERPLQPDLLLRLADNATLTERSHGWEWISELSLVRRFGDRAAVSLTGSGSGATGLGLAVERWRLATRFRHEALRRWLFVELEPESAWIRPAGGGRRRVLAFTVRLEVQLDAAAHRPR